MEQHKITFLVFSSFLGAFDFHNYSQSALGIGPGVAGSNILAFEAVALTAWLTCYPHETFLLLLLFKAIYGLDMLTYSL